MTIRVAPPRWLLALLLGSLSFVFAATSCGAGSRPVSRHTSRPAEVVIGPRTDPVSACSTLLPPGTMSDYLGYQPPAHVSLSRARSHVKPSSGTARGWSLLCTFTDDHNPDKAYHVDISPAVPHGPSGLVTVNGVTISGSSSGIVPPDEAHLIPLFHAVATRVGFSR